MDSTTLNDLKVTRELLSHKTSWTRNKMFGNRKGEAVARPDATCYCLMGAMMQAVGGRGTLEGQERYDAMTTQLEPHFEQCSIAKFNDDPNTTHDGVLAVLDKAIAS